MSTTATAILKLKVEGGREVTSEVRAAAADLVKAQKDIERASVDAVKRIEEAQKAAADRTRNRRKKDQAQVVQETQQVVAQEGGIYRKAAVVVERAEQLLTRAKLRELALRGDAQKRFVQLYTEAEKRATAAVEAEVGKRAELSEREKRQIQTVALAMVSQHEQAERRRTAATAREVDRRRQLVRQGLQQVGQGVSEVGGAVVHAGVQFLGQAHGEFQDARGRRAVANRSLGTAVRNAGGSDQDVAAAETRLRGFVLQTGMPYEVVANALATGQARGSSLEAGDGRTQAQALEESLSIVREANGEGADPGQYLAARGRLAAAGLRGDSLRDAMRFALAAAQTGQVEVDQLLQQGLPGATQLMESRVNALGPNATDAQKQTARLTAWRESVSTQEVLAASGGSSRQTSGALANLQNFMITPRRQEMALNNIRVAESQINRQTPEGRTRAAALRALYEGDQAIFERDPTRRGHAMRLRGGITPTELATRVAAATGSPQGAANVFAGGGQGNPQAFLANMRALLAVLGSERGQRIQQMMGGGGLSGETIAAHQAAVEGDEVAKLTRNQEIGTNALTDNTSHLKALSDQIAELTGRHPHLANAGSKVPAVVAAGTGAATTVTGGLLMAGGTTAGVAGVTAAGATTTATGGFVVSALGLLAQRGAITGRDLAGNELSTTDRLLRAINVVPITPYAAIAGANDISNGLSSPEGINTLIDLLPTALARELRVAPMQVTVQVPPGPTTDGVHAQTTNAGNGGR